jgi:HEAT repeat protein
MKPRNQCSEHLNVQFSDSPLQIELQAGKSQSAGMRRTPNASRDRASRLCRAISTLLLALAVSAGQAGAASTNIDAKMAVSARQARAASANSDVNKEKERKLIDILKSDVPPADKAVPCKQLVVYGTKDAVPVLAALLPDPQLASWARIALEAIPDPAADEALRQAVPRLQGKLLVGVINSIGVRHDPKAVGALVKKLKDADPEVASAAAVALGHIGGANATKALTRALPGAADGVRSAVAQGSILCAEKFLAQGKRAEAIKVYDTVRKAEVPKQRMLEATRGAILARGSAGLPLLLEQLRATDKGRLAIGLHTARELPGKEVTEALAAEVRRGSPDRQSFLLLALAERTDDAVLPAVLEATRSGPVKVRLAAVGVLDRMGNISSVPVLLDAASDSDVTLSQTAQAALARMPGNKVDSDLLGRLPRSGGKMRQVLIELAGQRRIESALPALVQSAEDPDPGVRSAAVQAIGVLGGDKEAADLARLLSKAKSGKERDDMETALIALSGRSGAGCVPHLLPLTQSGDSGLRTIGLHALASAGGPDALAAVKSAIQDSDESVQDEAVRTLSTWPNNWPDDAGVAEPLLALAKSDKKMSHQVLGLRGYLEYIKGDKRIKDDEKAAKVSELLPLLKRPEEKRLAIAALDGISTPAALEMLTTFAAEPAIADDACSAILSVTGKSVEAVPKEQRQKALQLVVENSKSADTKKRAEDLLKKIQ